MPAAGRSVGRYISEICVQGGNCHKAIESEVRREAPQPAAEATWRWPAGKVCGGKDIDACLAEYHRQLPSVYRTFDLQELPSKQPPQPSLSEDRRTDARTAHRHTAPRRARYERRLRDQGPLRGLLRRLIDVDTSQHDPHCSRCRQHTPASSARSPPAWPTSTAHDDYLVVRLPPASGLQASPVWTGSLPQPEGVLTS